MWLRGPRGKGRDLAPASQFVRTILPPLPQVSGEDPLPFELWKEDASPFLPSPACPAVPARMRRWEGEGGDSPGVFLGFDSRLTASPVFLLDALQYIVSNLPKNASSPMSAMYAETAIHAALHTSTSTSTSTPQTVHRRRPHGLSLASSQLALDPLFCLTEHV